MSGVFGLITCQSKTDVEVTIYVCGVSSEFINRHSRPSEVS